MNFKVEDKVYRRKDVNIRGSIVEIREEYSFKYTVLFEGSKELQYFTGLELILADEIDKIKTEESIQNHRTSRI